MLVVWFLLLAVPFQGFASATMLFWAPIDLPAAHMAVAAPAHDHAAMVAAGHHGQAHEAPATHGGDQVDVSVQHDGGKCTSCAACCVGASIGPSDPLRLTAEPPHRASAPFVPGFIPSVERALLKRPPQA
jgi:hypothetical protein